jgi:hypothetical protein
MTYETVSLSMKGVSHIYPEDGGGMYFKDIGNRRIY